jgi:hypothetical protein
MGRQWSGTQALLGLLMAPLLVALWLVLRCWGGAAGRDTARPGRRLNRLHGAKPAITGRQTPAGRSLVPFGMVSNLASSLPFDKRHHAARSFTRRRARIRMCSFGVGSAKQGSISFLKKKKQKTFDCLAIRIVFVTSRG